MTLDPNKAMALLADSRKPRRYHQYWLFLNDEEATRLLGPDGPTVIAKVGQVFSMVSYGDDPPRLCVAGDYWQEVNMWMRFSKVDREKREKKEKAKND